MPLPKDTIITEEFVPVTSFIHTIKVERARHQFTSAQEKEGQYPNAYFNEVASRDSTTAFSIKNVFGIALLEGFNKYAKAGLTAYISHKFNRYELMDTLSRTRFDEQELFVGGELAKRQGKTLHYNVNGEIGIMDKALGQLPPLERHRKLLCKRLCKQHSPLFLHASLSLQPLLLGQ